LKLRCSGFRSTAIVLKWIAATTLLAFATALALFALTPARLLAAHVIFALGVVPLILAAMGFFVPVLTRSRAPERAIRLLPVAALGGGLLVALHFAAPAVLARIDLVAAALLAVVALLLGWVWQRARAAIGSAHPGLGWYAAALVCLVLALAAIVLMPWLGSERALLRSLQLTAVGTLQVLMPTVAGTPDPEASRRLRLDLPWALTGALLVALAALDAKLAWAGALLWAVVLLRLGWAWWRHYRAVMLAPHHAAAALAGAWLGLALLLAAGVLHGAGIVPAVDAVPAFVLAFLLPLVSGALSWLLPAWWRPGSSVAWQTEARAALARHSALRAALFAAAGAGMLLGQRAAIALAVAGLLLFASRLPRALRAPR
jgi:hypothetical protein